MTVAPSIDPARFLEEHLAQASPDLGTCSLPSINTLLSADADAVCGADYRAVSDHRINRPEHRPASAANIELPGQESRQSDQFPNRPARGSRCGAPGRRLSPSEKRAKCGRHPVGAGLTSRHYATVAILHSMGFIFDLLAGIVGDALMPEWRGRNSGKVGCGLRVIAGSQNGLKGSTWSPRYALGWYTSRAIVYPGRLEFGRRTPISLPILTIVTDRQREPTRRERLWPLDLTYQIVELTTETATLEWAVPEDKLEWAVERLRGSEISSA